MQHEGTQRLAIVYVRTSSVVSSRLENSKRCVQRIVKFVKDFLPHGKRRPQ